MSVPGMGTSSWKTRLLSSINELVSLLGENEDVPNLLIVRILSHIEGHKKRKYANPQDAPIAAYLWALWKHNRVVYVRLLDDAVKDHCLFWARLVAHRILKEDNTKTLRREIPDHILERSLQFVRDEISRQLKDKGKGTFSSRHEILGMVDEEHDELKDAVRSEGIQRVKAELADIAVGCIWGIASIEAGTIDW